MKKCKYLIIKLTLNLTLLLTLTLILQSCKTCVGSSCKPALVLLCQRGISSQTLIAVTELCLYGIYGTRCVSYL